MKGGSVRSHPHRREIRMEDETLTALRDSIEHWCANDVVVKLSFVLSHRTGATGSSFS